MLDGGEDKEIEEGLKNIIRTFMIVAGYYWVSSRYYIFVIFLFRKFF